jgi:16S rRNA (cytosine1402-N4)-methyltransferase
MQKTDPTYHTPVLVKQSLEGLQIREGGIYVDVTFGGGGHAWEIYSKLSTGKLIAFDQDPDAVRNTGRFQTDALRSFLFVPANFQYLAQYLKFHKVSEVDGILADLGVSSHQFDAADRGFSIRFQGKLDMRMDQKRSISAIHVINEYTEAQLVHVFSYYGEIKNAKTLAGAIVRERQKSKIETTSALRSIASAVAPKGKEHKYLAQLFQAVRMEVNDELGALKSFLEQSVSVLKPGGRLVVISYHSLEDRLVKDFMATGNFKGKVEKDFFGNVIRPFSPVTKKPILPDDAEIGTNNRARSAKLRIATKN